MAASVTNASLIGKTNDLGPETSDPMVKRLRRFLQALCPAGQRLLLPLLTSAGQATAPGTPAVYVGRHADVADHEQQLRQKREYGRDRLKVEGFWLESDNDDTATPVHARWAKADELDNPEFMDRPASIEAAFEEWAWYEHRSSEEQLKGMDEVRRCLGISEGLCLALSKLPDPARVVAQRIRRCSLLGADGGWGSRPRTAVKAETFLRAMRAS